ncbi:YybH family protein [Arenibacterium sp. CAU 1754]
MSGLIRSYVRLWRLAAVLVFFLPAVAQAQENPAHEEIRAMRDAMIGAFIERDKDKLLTYFTEDVIFTAMNNEVVRGLEAADVYYDRMMEGSESIVTDLDVDFAVDDLTTLYAQDQTGIAAGDVTTAFKMRAGLEFTVPLRWTAAMVREEDGWKVSALHFSANMFDNPLDSSIRNYLWLMLAAAAVGGLVIGGIVGRMTSR